MCGDATINGANKAGSVKGVDGGKMLTAAAVSGQGSSFVCVVRDTYRVVHCLGCAVEESTTTNG